MKNVETSLVNNFRDDGKKVVSFLVHCFIVTALSFRITLQENSLMKFEKREFIFSYVFRCCRCRGCSSLPISVSTVGVKDPSQSRGPFFKILPRRLVSGVRVNFVIQKT